MQKFALFCVISTLFGTIWAQERGFRGGFGRTPAFQALDTDRDGAISPAEIAAAPNSLKTLDKNADGKLTEDEIRPQMGGRGGRGGREEPGENAGPSADDLVKLLMAF